MSDLKRILHLDLPEDQSAFLWGARKTGKSTFLRQTYPQSIVYDLLKSDFYLQLSKSPHLLREEISALSPQQLKNPIIIDEVQKIPALIDEIHWLIENTKAYFILCGSSTRKLKRETASLLGGRAWRFEFFPLVSCEIPDFDLLHALNAGLIPSHYLHRNYKRSLKAYIEDYLKLEIQAESLTRNLPAFARFLDACSFSQGELVNFTNIARDCGIDAKTVKQYFQILEDTLVGRFVYPFTKKSKREIISATPKFYLFDVGVANYLAHRTISAVKGADAGKAFEHFIWMELTAYNHLMEKEQAITFWRTKTGLEVDFIISPANIAIEVKISENPSTAELRSLVAFHEEYQAGKLICVCLAPRARKIKLPTCTIDLIPWREFLGRLWAKEVF